MRKFFFIIIILALLFITIKTANAQERTGSQSSLIITPAPVEYQLPYPGLLPDNPLYFLKVFRDRIVEFLISDPLKKAEFNLLEADKRLNAGVYVFKKGKVDLAESSISKGENYFEKAISETMEAKKQGMDISDISKKLLISASKHEEILNNLESKTDNSRKSKFSAIGKRVYSFKNQVDLLKPK